MFTFNCILLPVAFTFGFAVTSFVLAAFILAMLPASLGNPYLQVMLILYTMTIVGIMTYIFWLDRGTDPRDKQDPLLYLFFPLASLIPWIASNWQEVLIMTFFGFCLMFMAFRRAVQLHQQMHRL